jgi:tetratricopeptide (TPR) repeat protein
MTPDSSPEHLAELRRRWQAEPGSRLFLQLAEEYRRADRHAEAVEVLEKGLEQHPNHVSAHVALGRVRLDMGEPGSAAQALERALELDVTNLVANKLLIEAYLGRGERERARQRLELYRLLNDSDPDVADLRRRIDGGRTVAPPPPARDAAAGEVTFGADDTAAGVASAPDEVLAEGRSWGGEATADSLEPPAGEPAGRAIADTPATDSAAVGGRGAVDALQEEPMTTGTGPADEWDGRGAAPEVAGSAGGRESAAGQPFGDLAAGGAERRYLEALGGEGLFSLPPSVLPPTSDAPPESLPEPRPAEIEALTEEATPAAAAAPTAAAAPGPAAEASAAGIRLPDERPTVTLGQLYLDQGHFAQARRVFAALLDEEPDHEVARRGLDRAERELAASGPEPLTAAELLRDAEPEQPARRALLGAYLARILRSRESRPSDVPR